MTALATTEQLIPRLDWQLSPAEIADAEGALEYLSDLARQVAGKAWPDVCPPLVRGTILAAAVRYMRNYDGLTQSRAGDETMGWDGIGDKAGAPYFTSTEERTIKASSGVGGIVSVSFNAWGTSTDRVQGNLEWAPTGPNSKPFPIPAGEDV